jgi:thioesterase domain-containing protein
VRQDGPGTSEIGPEARENGPRAAERGSTAVNLTAMLLRGHAEGRLAEVAEVLSGISRFSPAFTDAATVAVPRAALVSDGPGGACLICVPSFLAGSGPHQFVRLAASLPSRRRVSALTLPGLAPGAPLPGSWQAAVELLARSVRAAAGEREFVLVGHSIGGLLAYAAGQELERTGRGPTRLVMIDTLAPAPGNPQLFAWAMGHILDRGSDQLAIGDSAVLAMANYLRLADGVEPERTLRVPVLQLRPTAPVPGDGHQWPDWQVADSVVGVAGDHFSVLEADAATTAGALHDWLAGS